MARPAFEASRFNSKRTNDNKGTLISIPGAKGGLKE